MSTLSRVAFCIALTACLLDPRRAHADPFTSSQTVIEDLAFNFFTNDGTTSSALTVGADSASSFIDLATSRMGASIDAPDRAAQIRTSTEHGDVWSCGTGGTGCLALVNPDRIPLGLDVHFDATFSPAHASEMSFEAAYLVSSGQAFTVSFSQDPTFAGSAQFVNGSTFLDVPLVTTIDAQGNFHVTVDFSTVFDVRCAQGCVVNDAGFSPFSDTQKISAELEGTGFIDAAHTFQVTLTPLDPGIALVSADGRLASSAPATVSEPGSMLLLGAGLLGAAARLQKRRARSSNA